MKKTSSFNARSGVKKQQENKTSSTTRGSSKVSGFGTSSAAFNRRSPVVTDQTIATNSVIQAATDPKIKELVMKQQQIFERESMDKRTPRNNSRDSRADGVSFHFHSVDHNSSAATHQSFQQQQQFWKTALDIGDSGPSESSVESPEKSFGSSKFLASSPDTHHHQLHHFMQQQCATTPGSAVETVVHDVPIVSSQNDDDGAGSEVTADAGYMMMHKQNLAVPVDAMGVSPSAAATAGTSPSMRSHLHMYMDMNASLLHDHHTLAVPTAKGHHTSPLNHGIAGVSPPPLLLPQAGSEPAVSGAGGSLLLDPKELNDEALKAAYFRFLVEMETRGLQSMTLNAAPTATAAPIVGLSSSSNGMNGAQVPVVESNSRMSSPLAHAERVSTHNSASKSMSNTAHTTHLNPNTNPVDIRKNVYRSKSGGSEAAFFPNGGSFSGASVNSAPLSGRKTPNSPLMGRYMHSSALADAAHEELNWAPEGEDAELRKAFGQYRHPGSPSYPAYSPFHHLTQPFPGNSHHALGHGHHPAGGHHVGTTPTSVAVGSANWNGASTASHATAPASGVTHANHATTSRSVSRCSGVVPASDDLLPGMRSNCLSTLPPTYSQYMYTNGAQASGGAGSAGIQASGAGQNAAADLKTPKFVRKFQGMGAGLLGLTTQRYTHKDISEREEDVEVSKKSRSGSGGGSSQTGKVAVQHASSSTNSGNHASSATVSTRSSHHGRDSAASLQSKTSDFDNSIDAVKIAGGFDQLLLPGRLLSKRNSSLIPDEHSAFDDCSVGSMSLNSARSGGKKTAKTR